MARLLATALASLLILSAASVGAAEKRGTIIGSHMAELNSSMESLIEKPIDGDLVPLTGFTTACSTPELDVLSDDPADYSLSVHMAPDGKTAKLVIYGRLIPGKSYSSLERAKEAFDLSSNQWMEAELGWKKVFLWWSNEFIEGLATPAQKLWAMLVEAALNDTNCEAIATHDSALDGELIRCELLYDVPTEGKSFSEVMGELKSMNKAKMWLSSAGFFCTGPIDMTIASLALAGEADADQDGVPDSIDNCTSVPNFSQEITEGSASGDACASVAVDTSASDGEGESSTGSTQAGSLTPTAAAGEGGGACSLIGSHHVGISIFLLIAALIAAVMGRMALQPAKKYSDIRKARRRR